MTKLLAHEDCRLPTKDPQAFAIGRMLKLILTAVHRISQIMGAKDDINWYKDLLHYRNANNKRQSFHKLMVMVSRVLTCDRGRFLSPAGGLGGLENIHHHYSPFLMDRLELIGLHQLRVKRLPIEDCFAS